MGEVRADTADDRGSVNDDVRMIALEEIADGIALAQIELARARREHFAWLLRFDGAAQRGAEKTVTARDEDPPLSPETHDASFASFAATCKSASTISSMSRSNVVVGCQPSFCLAFVASPRRISTSVGRR